MEQTHSMGPELTLLRVQLDTAVVVTLLLGHEDGGHEEGVHKISNRNTEVIEKLGRAFWLWQFAV